MEVEKDEGLVVYGQKLQQKNAMMTQNENYVGWADDDDVDMQLLFSASSGCATSNKENVHPYKDCSVNTATTSASSSSPSMAIEPLSLFHPKRKRAVMAVVERSRKSSAVGRAKSKELSPYTATLERSLQQRRLQRTKRRSAVNKDPNNITKQDTTTEEDPFGDLLDLDDSDFAAIDDLVLSRGSSAGALTPGQQHLQQQQQTVDLFDELPDEDFFGAIIDPSDVNDPIEEFQPLELPPDFKNPKSFDAVQNSSHSFMFSRYVVAHVHEVTQHHIKYLFVFPYHLKQQQMQPSMISPSQCKQISLAGEWFYNHVEPGDIVHIISPSGLWRTDFSSLPLILKNHQEDDILLVVEPDVLVAPTLISEALGCSRRAVLRHRMGSGPFSSKSCR